MKYENHCSHRGRGTMVGLAILLTICFAASSSFADTLTEGSVLPSFGVVSVGSAASFNINGSPITGPILIGFGSTITGSGCSNFNPPPPSCSSSGARLQINTSGSFTMGSFSVSPAPTFLTAPASFGVDAFNDAAALSAAAQALQPTVGPLGNITGARTFVGNGGLNVIDIGTWTSNPGLTLVGGPDDFFIFNLTSLTGLSNSNAWNIGNVPPSNILFNLLGTGTVFNTSGGSCNTRFGTFLATKGGNFTGSNMCIEGQAINTAGSISASNFALVSFEPFEGPAGAEVPEPSGFILLATGLGGIVAATRRKLRL